MEQKIEIVTESLYSKHFLSVKWRKVSTILSRRNRPKQAETGRNRPKQAETGQNF